MSMSSVVESVEKVLPSIHRPPLERTKVCSAHGEFTSRCHVGNVWTGCSECAREYQERQVAEQARGNVEAARAEWGARLGRAGIPPRFIDRTFANYVVSTEAQQQVYDSARAYAQDFAAVRKTGRGAIFIGGVGTGKTHLAVAIGKHAMRQHGASVLFMTVKRAIRSIKDTWVKGSMVSESQAVEVLTYPDLLILDEVGVQSDSEHERQVLFDVLNERYESRKPTIFLSNKTEEQVAALLGERVMDRLREDGAQIVPFGWASARGSLTT